LGWLAFAPLVLLALLVGVLRSGQSVSHSSLREQILQASLLVGVSISLGTETLSVFHLVAAVALFLRRRNAGPPAPLRFPVLDVADVCLLAGIAAIALITFVVAWLSPPQSSDAVSYHMGRVMHWIQNGTIAPYPTYDSRQLYHPPFAEIVQLHLHLLTGSDRAGCLLQWFASMGTMLAASVLARDLGGGRRAQILAAFVVVTLPIGITQATSGKNGWVEALWLLSLACFSGAAAPRGAQAFARGRTITAFAALGLGILTKLTSWLFAGPVVVVAIVRALRTPGLPLHSLAISAAAGGLLVCALTLPFLARNVSVYGNPVVDPVARERSGLTLVTPAVVVSNVLRNSFFQFGTGSASVNEALTAFVVKAHEWIGADPYDDRTSQFDPFRVSPPTRAEALALSPLHILLLVGTGIALLSSRRLRAHQSRLPYLAAVAAGYLLFCATVTFQAPNCRLLMPLLVLAAPLVAVVVVDVAAPPVLGALALMLFAAGVPYATGTESRPLSLEAGKGVLVTPRKDLYFTRFPQLRSTYDEVARVVEESRTRNLGVVFTHAGDPEYLLWVALADADRPPRIEHVNVTDASGRLAVDSPWRDFRPELVVVFASDAKARFDPEISAAGTAMTLQRRFGSAAFYTPAAQSRGD
jgi:4-amino-4-deoxy-L-arabinose transferase-like glycosyltransferase